MADNAVLSGEFLVAHKAVKETAADVRISQALSGRTPPKRSTSREETEVAKCLIKKFSLTSKTNSKLERTILRLTIF